MRSAKRIGIVALALGVSLVGVMVTGSSAQAAASQCPSGSACLFQGNDYTGGYFRIKDGGNMPCDLDLGDNTYDNGARVVDSASSFINNTGYTLWLVENPYPYMDQGRKEAIAPGKRATKLSSLGMDNKVSAVC